MRTVFIYLFILFAVIACKEIYESPVKATATGYLVVEGVINSGPGVTTITLSRTTSLDNRTIQYETGAAVSIEGEDNTTRVLSSRSDGHYDGVDLNLNNATKYRLKIRTSDAKEFVSDFTAVRNNPPIDSISWKRESSGLQENGVQFYVNTHDPQNNTRYYQWEYVETWEYHAVYQSRVKYQIGNLPSGEKRYKAVYYSTRQNEYDSSLYYCWQNFASTNLNIGSSAKLSNDQITQQLVFVPKASEKISVLYSVNVRQYSWSKEGYEFLERMKKNTEQTGSVFDAQPSAINGNIHCTTDPTEPVIGFVTICPIQEKRVFLENRALLPGWGYQPLACTQDTIKNISDTIIAYGLGKIPTNVPDCGMAICPTEITLFMAAQPACVDCALNGGTNTKPNFWPW